ncbi:MAG: methylated-DNA--[protein]-cysteine S-methyltransferase [Sphingomonas sp.]|nr:methylated-DNA--[protein]-cysteine S-methyltransferase [Sphingomonas sp.]OQW45571.1 MAG: cysteine methyltransferase [Proteobacteria bacterium SG_bin6]
MYARDHGGIATPIGTVAIELEQGALARVTIGGAVSRGTSALAIEALRQLEAWFAGERRDFDLPLAPVPTPRGAELRAGLVAVGYGETLSYGALAKRLGSSARAIGQLCARNPLPIVVPCHRVLGANGVLGHYSAGEGSATKAWLIAHERGESR